MKTVARSDAGPVEPARVLKRVRERGRLGKRPSRRKASKRVLKTLAVQLVSSAGSSEDNDSSQSQSSSPPPPPSFATTESRADHVTAAGTANPFSRELVALDCEMVATRRGSALAQCSILSYDGETLFHAYIRPSELITDYRTRWSGILPSHMKLATPHEQAVTTIRQILEGKILIGHDLTHDLSVIGISPPKHRLRDTAYFKPLRSLAGLVSNWNPSLKNLSLRFLGRQIQRGSHNSMEDAQAALDLYRKHERLWETYLVEQEWDRTVWLQDQFWPQDMATQ